MSRAARIRSILGYDKDTGVFVWLVSKGKCKAGSVAGTSNTTGHVQISVDGKKYLAHRLAWLYTHGRLPSSMIDHINGNKLDNRTSNLRHVEFSENMLNLPRRADSLSGVTGVNFDRPTGKWRARYQINKRRICLGLFETAEQAEEAVINARAVAGFLPSHGRAA